MEEELKESKKYYKKYGLELNRIIIGEEVLIEEISTKDKEVNQLEYNLYIKLPTRNEYVNLAKIEKDGTFSLNEEILESEEYTDEEKKMLGDMLNLLGFEQGENDLSKIQEQLKEIEAKTREEIEQELDKDRQKDDEIKDDNEEEQEKEEDENDDKQEKDINDDKQKEEIAKKYNVNSKDVVHLNTGYKKLTEDRTLSGLAKWAKGKKDVYVVADKKGKIQAVLERKGNEFEEVEHNMQQIHGNVPSVEIHLINNNKIETVKPLKIYEIDSNQAFATIRNSWGELETIYCRKQEGREEYFGEKVPEMSGKNVKQQNFDERSFMDTKNNSGIDLARKADELNIAKDHDDRGIPSKEKGVQVEEINGNNEQNRIKEKENIEEDLYKRLGIDEKMKANLMPGQLKYLEEKISDQAEKIQELMQDDLDITYEQAVEKIEQQEKTREEGGITPGENNKRR